MLRAPFPWFGGKRRVSSVVWQRFGDVPNYVEPFAGSLAVLLGRPTTPRVETVNDMDCYISNFWRAMQADPQELARWADWPINEADLHARHLWLVQRDEFRERMKTASGLVRRLPKIDRGTASRLTVRRAAIVTWFEALASRLHSVRVCCGDWARILGPSPTECIGITGVFLDPPYDPAAIAEGAGRNGFAVTDKLYAHHDAGLSARVREWALAHGHNPKLRIALCGYEGEHDMPSSWACVAWKSAGGYSNRGDGAGRNAKRERIWFSPHCLGALQVQLFA